MRDEKQTQDQLENGEAMIFGQLIREKREAHPDNLTIQKVADLSGVSIGTISNLERGACDSKRTTIDRILHVIGATYDAIKNETQQILTVNSEKKTQYI